MERYLNLFRKRFMRTRLVALAGSLFLGACVSGTRVVYVPVADASNTPVAAPAPTPAQVAPPQVVEAPLPPIGVTIVRADQGRLLVSLDQPAYLAVFDIVPGRGVSLLYPASPRQRQVLITGSRWLDPRWSSMVGYYDDGASGR